MSSKRNVALRASGEPAWPASRVEKWPIEKLAPYERNAKSHPDEQVDQLVALIKEFGWTTAILVDEKGEIIAGHGRLLAAQRLHLKAVPVMVAKGWTDAQKLAYLLADNHVSTGGAWIPDFVRIELAELGKLDYDVSAFGLEDIE